VLPERAVMPSLPSRTSRSTLPLRPSRAASRPIHTAATTNATPNTIVVAAAAALASSSMCIRSRQTADSLLLAAVIVEDFFHAVRDVERPGMSRIFIRPDPTKHAFMDQAVFLWAELFRPEASSSRPRMA
jgi:hypothetical protein